MWISSDDLGIIREDVRLEDKIVESVTWVDSVEKFGLSSVQTFTVTESIESCQVLKVRFRYASSIRGHDKFYLLSSDFHRLHVKLSTTICYRQLRDVVCEMSC